MPRPTEPAFPPFCVAVQLAASRFSRARTGRSVPRAWTAGPPVRGRVTFSWRGVG